MLTEVYEYTDTNNSALFSGIRENTKGMPRTVVIGPTIDVDLSRTPGDGGTNNLRRRGSLKTERNMVPKAVSFATGTAPPRETAIALSITRHQVFEDENYIEYTITVSFYLLM